MARPLPDPAGRVGGHGLIDPLAPGLDLQPFFDLMSKPDVIKVFHAARQDIEIMVHAPASCRARCSTPRSPPWSAASAIRSATRPSCASWPRRRSTSRHASQTGHAARSPTSSLAYALADVTHLRVVYEKLKLQLDSTGREHWLREEMDILTNPATYRTEPEDAWRRIKVRLKSKKQLGVLVAVSAWREHEAREKNVPRSRILKDDAISEIAVQLPQTRQALGELRALPKGFANSRTGEAILTAVKAGLEADPKTLPVLDNGRDEVSEQTQAAAEILKLALKVVCGQEGIAPKLVASSSDIEAIAENDAADVALRHGWRREVFGNLALDIKAGRAMIGLYNGKVTIVRQDIPKAEAAE